MAQRPVFLPSDDGPSLVHEQIVDFQWIPGMALSQARKRLTTLHEATRKQLGIDRILDISSKSPNELGVQLSAFNLAFRNGGSSWMTVETAYQGSKVFSCGGPFTDLLYTGSMDAKQDDRLQSSGRIVAFEIGGKRWPLFPTSAFYDWLYLSALRENPDLARGLVDFEVFTDIVFNPKKSTNCQARSAALYVAFVRRGRFDVAMTGQEAFLKELGKVPVSLKIMN